MGEIADDLISRLFDPRFEDFDDWNGFGEPHYSRCGVSNVRCNRCGSIDVRWNREPGRWVLYHYKDDTPHVCKINADDFDVVPE